MTVTRPFSPGGLSATPASLDHVRSLRVQLAVCVLLGAAIRVAAFSIGPLERLDIDALTARWPGPDGRADHLARAIASPFEPLPYVLLLLCVLIAAALHGRAVAGIAAAGVMLGASATTEVLKHVLAAPRTIPGDYLPPDAWPSGHTTAAAALGIGLVLITPRVHRLGVAIAAVVLTAAVGASVVVLGWHVPSDVLGGVCVAAAWGAIGFHAVELSSARRVAR
jgi:membrane-associated phospholipid phosphatase